ncbi:hypothetical protein C8F01DRAFT_1010158 [Mycena amicta]|nr:hypothetical protein C8F01DRAFT_1010158 [Mycena amicta]
MANNTPDEILTEILRPLLKHSDAAFCDTSEKPLLAVRRFKVSSYLLVNKAWLRASTPLLYNVVILRTTAQATALESVLKRYPDIGNYILKLRVEGGFGTAMHTILKCARRLRELFISLVFPASDNVKGLCSGLPLVNPHSVYLYDRNHNLGGNGFAKNKKVDELFQTIVSIIPKWNNLKLFDFPYFPQTEQLMTTAASRVLDARTEKLVSALASSQTLETVLLYMGVSAPSYLHQLISIPTFKTLQFRNAPAIVMVTTWQSRMVPFYSGCRQEIEMDPKLSLYATFPLPEVDAPTNAEGRRGIEDEDLLNDFGNNSDSDYSDDDHWFLETGALSRDRAGNQSNPIQSRVTEPKLELIQDLGERCGDIITSLIAGGFRTCWPNDPRKPDDMTPLSLTIFADFTALTKLTLIGDDEDPHLTKPTEEFCKTMFPKLESLNLSDATPQMVDLFAELSLPALHTVRATVIISYANRFPDAINWNSFLTVHGGKLRSLNIMPFGGPTVGAKQWANVSPGEQALRTQLRIFELCPNLCDLSFRVVTSAPKEGAVVAPEKPHNSLARICFDAVQLTKKEEAAMRTFFLNLFTADGDNNSETVENKMFPVLREVKFTPIQWPTSEARAAKHHWMMLAEKMEKVGIAVVDAKGTKGERRAHTDMSRGKGTKKAITKKGNTKRAKGKGKARESDSLSDDYDDAEDKDE